MVNTTPQLTGPKILWKTPREIATLGFDFKGILLDQGTSDAETISSVTDLAVISSTTDILVGNVSDATISGTRVLFTCSSGTSGVDYIIECAINTSQSQTRTLSGELRVRRF